MNPLENLSAGAKLLASGAMLLIVCVIGFGVYSLFSDRAQLKAIKRGDAAIAAGNKQANKTAEKRDNARDAYHAALASQAAAAAKEIENDEDFGPDARAVYFRVWDDALRGAKR